MKRYVVLGVNENPKYLYYLPLVCWAWKYFGWNSVVFYAYPMSDVFGFICDYTIDQKIDFQPAVVPFVNVYKSETMAQVSRLYGAAVVEDDSYLMTSDVDMLPLSKNIFHYEGHRVLSIGRDLTDYHYPICYIGGRAKVWQQFMDIQHKDYYACMIRDMRQQKNMWTLDQDIVTDKLLDYGIQNINHIDRGTDQRTGYPIGRVDRSHWTLDHKTFIDAHLPHDVLTNEKSFHNVMQLLHTVWPKEDWKWFINYTKEFKKL